VGKAGMTWIDIAQDRDRWRALVNAVITLWVPYHTGIADQLRNSLSEMTLLRGVILFYCTSILPCAILFVCSLTGTKGLKNLSLLGDYAATTAE
jgi:hypothetical protein